MASKQVYIGKVADVIPIPGADKIEAVVAVCGAGGRWCGVVQKGQFIIDSPCQVYLQDSLLPQTPEFAFMARYSYRVRMARFRGMPSEALIFPQTISGNVGDDITGQAGVTKYEKPIPTCLAGEIYGDFPRFIPKTDEPNFQGVPEMVEALRGQPYYATVKVDGSSGTAYRLDGHFGVCSRNWELKETEGNAFWRCMTEPWRNIPEGYAVQFEVAGPGIQGNAMGLKTIQPFAFQVWNIAEKRYLHFEDFTAFSSQYHLPTVEMLEHGPAWMYESDDALRSLAEGTYSNGKQREGIVLRPQTETWMSAITGLNDHCSVGLSSVNRRLSFKVINLLYKEA
jgi:RNA ligase (TIGR02306 family)